MEDHKRLRELPLEALAGVLEFNLSKFRQRKEGREWTGPCPIHRPRKTQARSATQLTDAFSASPVERRVEAQST